MTIRTIALLLLPCFYFPAHAFTDSSKVRIAIAGLSHDHVGGFVFGRQHADAEIVGIYETSDSLFQYYAKNITCLNHYIIVR